MLHKVEKLVLPWLVEIYRGCIKLNYVPKSWQQARVVFIPKAGTTNQAKAKDYRPISLTSFLLKTLERVLDSYIRDRLEPNFISKAQHAYIKGRSVDTALHDVVFEIEKTLHCKEFMLCCFLDIEGAFNNVKIETIENAMEAAKVEVSIKNWITTLLKNRKVTAEWGGVTTRKSVHRGTPQGGVLSPLLWLLVVNVPLKKLEREGIKPVDYADDIAIMLSGICPNTLSEIMEGALAKVSGWAKSSGLRVNAEKTELVLFTKRYKIPAFRAPVLEGTPLVVRSQAKFLGIILDKRLTWKPNIEERVAKASKAFYTCNRFFGKRWGLQPNITHWVYTAIIRPILLYGATVWWPAAEIKTHKKYLEKAQRLAEIGISGAMRTTATDSLNTILYIPPIDLFAKFVASRAILRLKVAGLLKIRNYGHSRLGINLNTNTDFLTPNLHFGRKFDITIPSREFWESTTATTANSIKMYTDGSKLSTGVGAAVYCQELSVEAKYKLPKECSIFQAEIVAIHKAAEIACNSTADGTAISIFVDSQAALKALGSYEIKSKALLSCYEALQDLGSSRRVELLWVPGHCGITGNEEADKLAKEGAEAETLTLESILPPLQEVRKTLYNNMIKCTEQRWSRITGCKITKIMWGGPDLKKTKTLLGLTRAQCSLLVGIHTGHCYIGEHAFRIGALESNLCRHCQNPEAIESVEHLLCHCPAFMTTRHRFLGDYLLKNLEEASRCPLRSILGFAMHTGCFNPDYNIAGNAHT